MAEKKRERRRRDRRQIRNHPENRTDTCGACGTPEGHLHELYCDMERCPFCGGQLSSCDCATKHFYPNSVSPFDPASEGVPFCGLPQEVYEKGLSEAQYVEWEQRLETKGRIPFIRYPIVCAKCGVLWPELFMDSEWDQYIEPRVRREVICRPCFLHIKKLIDSARAV